MWQAPFLEAYGQLGNVSDAARQAGVESSTVRAAKARQAEFAAQMAAAEEDFKDRVRREVYRRGVVGWDEPVFGTVRDAHNQMQHQQVGAIRRYSDRMLELLAKAKMPEEYGDRVKIDYAEEVRRVGRELGKSDEEIAAAVREAEVVVARRREEMRRRV